MMEYLKVFIIGCLQTKFPENLKFRKTEKFYGHFRWHPIYEFGDFPEIASPNRNFQ